MILKTKKPVKGFFQVFTIDSKPFMIMSQYTTNENVPDVWYNHPSVRLIDRRKSLSER